MTGLCGVFRTDRSSIPNAVVGRMERAIEHRAHGPIRRVDLDEAVISSVGGDLSDGKGRISVAVDGVILDGAGSRESSPDGSASAVAGDYESRAASFPGPLRGEFAVVLWDSQERRGLIVRDPYGARPVYVAEVPGGVLFASELQAILDSQLVETTLDYSALEIYLDLGFFPAPWTPLRAVRKVRAAHSVHVSESRLGPQRPYWHLPKPAASDESEEAIVERAGRALDASVALHLSAAEAPGVLLSAGLDSALMLGLVLRHARSPLALTFAVSGCGFAADLAGAAHVARELGVEHRAVTVSLDAEAMSLAEFTRLIDEPVADLSALGYAALARDVAGVVDVAYAGTMADILFSASSASRRLEVIGYLDGLPQPLRRAAGATLGLGRGRLGRLGRILAADTPGERYRLQWALEPRERKRLLSRGDFDGSATSELLADLADGVTGHAMEVYSYLEQQLDGDSLLRVADRGAVAGPIDIRFPFADVDVAMAAATVPGKLRSRRGERKLVLRRLAEQVLPASLLERPKVGFLDPAIPDWTRIQLARGGSDLLLDPEAKSASFLQQGEVERQIRVALDGGPSGQLFGLLLLESWLSQLENTA